MDLPPGKVPRRGICCLMSSEDSCWARRAALQAPGTPTSTGPEPHPKPSSSPQHQQRGKHCLPAPTAWIPQEEGGKARKS